MTWTRTSKRQALATLAAAAVGVGVAVGAQAAFDEPLTAPLTFTGRIQGAGESDVDLDFAFRKGAPEVVCDVAVTAPLQSDGRFSVPLDVSGCPADFFSGGDAPTVTITVTSVAPPVVVVDDVPVGAVPFARFADNARNANTATLAASAVLAVTAGRLADAACPFGFEARDNAGVDECFRAVGTGEDVMIKVGVGNTSFWMDRYEAVVVNANNQLVLDSTLSSDGTGRSLLPTDRAVSVTDVVPRANVTWLEASTLCRNAGKRLPRRAEWLYAARFGTDPDDCNVNGPLAVVGTSDCRSEDGVEDLFGNVQEYMEEWAVGSSDNVSTSVAFGDDNDRVFNVSGQVINIEGQAPVAGLPAVEIRGGADAGIAAGYLFGGADRSPLNRAGITGFRCVIPR